MHEIPQKQFKNPLSHLKPWNKGLLRWQQMANQTEAITHLNEMEVFISTKSPWLWVPAVKFLGCQIQAMYF